MYYPVTPLLYPKRWNQEYSEALCLKGKIVKPEENHGYSSWECQGLEEVTFKNEMINRCSNRIFETMCSCWFHSCYEVLHNPIEM